MRFLPMFFDPAAGVILLVGSGDAALGKLRLLRAAGAHVRWFSRDADVAEEVSTLPGPGRLEISVGDPAKLIGRHRRRFSAVPRGLSPRRFWQNVIAGPIAGAVLAGRAAEAEAQLTHAIETSSVSNGDGGENETVFLVGAGPGDPD